MMALLHYYCMQCCNSAIVSWSIPTPLLIEHWLINWRMNRWCSGIDNGSWYKGCGFEPRRGKYNKLLMINIQKEKDGLSWDGLTWVGKMVRDDSGTGWKRDGLSRIHSTQHSIQVHLVSPNTLHSILKSCKINEDSAWKWAVTSI